MQIKEVKITGFKSFVDGVTLPIEAGLTGIVGPNGCGKSNILEALRWVMGATSAKALRGGEMDDVIFSGTDNRPPRDIAEVIMRIDNSSGHAPEPFKSAPNIEISRKIKRASGSTFRINGKEVRAKDVQLMFADASSGANSPALVRQGQISELINARPENRRKVLEEAAGIAGLQARRHEAQTKLLATEGNLERIGEIIIHMEEQIASLKKQAQRANKYRVLQGQIRGLEMYLLHQKLCNFQNQLSEVKKSCQIAFNQKADMQIAYNRALRELEDAEGSLPPFLEEKALADAILRNLETKKLELDHELQQANEKLANSQETLTRLQRDLARENEIANDATQSIEKITQEIANIGVIENQDDLVASLQLKVNLLKDEANELNAALLTLTDEKAKIRAQFDANLREFNALKSNIETLENQLAARKLALESAKNAIDNDTTIEHAAVELKKTEHDYEVYNKELMMLESEIQKLEKDEEISRKESQNAQSQIASQRAELKGLLAVSQNFSKSKNAVIELIKVAKGYEKAISVALGDDLNAQIGKGEDDFWGKCEIQPQWPNELLEKITLLQQIVEAPAELEPRLKAVGIVGDLDFELINNLPIGFRIVTQNGRLKRWDGFEITGKSPLPAAKRLEQINRIKELEANIIPLEETANLCAQQHAKLRATLGSCRDKFSNMRSKSHDWQKRLNEKRQKLAAANSELSRAKAQLENIENQISILNSQLEVQKQKRANMGEINPLSMNAQLSDIEIIENQKRSASTIIISKINDLKSQIMVIEREATTNRKRLDAAKSAKEDWKKRLGVAENRAKEIEAEIAQLIAQIAELKNRPQEIIDQKHKQLSELPRLEQRQKNANDNLALAQKRINDAQFESRQRESQLNAANEAIKTAQILQQTWDERISELANEAWNSNQIALDDIERLYIAELGDGLKNLSPEKAQKNLSRAFEERNDIGGVNLRADIELKEQTERMENLSRERDDLLAAIRKLRKAIDEINAEGQERLIKAFDMVNSHFVDLFTTLFGGGTAHLALTETDDPLGGGLEVYACPPGKRLASMSLMSGGEQALTASALIFAVFLSNPAPISVLDELDAPLDDANVDRFCTLMEEMRKRTLTRFIVITHHPITMSRMDRLFGVTMAERGVSNLVSVDLSRAQSMIEAT